MTAFRTQIILKNESFINEESNFCPEDTKYSNAIERKCGEVILLANTKFWFVCTFCDERFHNVVIFRNHIKGEHISDAENDFDKDDPLDFPRNEEEVVIKLDTDVTAIDCNNKVEDVDTSNSCYISTQNCNEMHFVPGQFENEMAVNIKTQTNKVTKTSIETLGLTEDILKSDDSENFNDREGSANGSLICRNIENLLSAPKNVPKKRNRKKKVHSCSICQHVARNKNSLQSHMLSHHGTGTQHQCEECGKCFRNRSNLKSHLVIHSGTRPYKCDFCDSGFSHPNSLKTHRYIHTGERPHKCNQCEKGFVSSSGLKIHKREHTGETPYVCQFCERGFANKCHYNRHIISHSNRRAFECKQCDKAFKHRETFNKHMICHTSEKKIVCDVCQKRFIHKKNLVQHKKIHSVIKQYTCKVCNKDFAQNAGLYSHMKYHKNKN